MSKIINCKTCGNDIAVSAKICPKCGAKNKKPFYKKWWVWMLALFVLAAIASPNDSNNTTTVQNDTSSLEATAVPETTNTPKPTVEPETNSPKITMEEFSSIQTNMTYEQVVKIIGSEGELTSQSSVGGYEMRLYTWEGNSFGANANVTFSNGKVSAKAQFGLK